MEFAETWRDYGVLVAVVAALLPYFGKLWLLVFSIIKRRLNHQVKRTEDELEEQRERQHEEAEAQRQRERDWIIEFKDLLTDYRNQRDLAVKRAERADVQLAALQRSSLTRTDQMMAEYIQIVKAKGREEAAVIEVLRDLTDLERRLLARLDQLEGKVPVKKGGQIWQVRREKATSTK